MARIRTEQLTDDLYRRLSGADIDALACAAIVVCTTDAAGWPHPALLSYFEVVAVDSGAVRLAVYNTSRTFANLRERGKAALIVADRSLICYIRATVTAVDPAMRVAPYNARVDLRVEEVVFDQAPEELEPGASVTSGITYSPRTGAAMARARAVLDELLEGTTVQQPRDASM